VAGGIPNSAACAEAQQHEPTDPWLEKMRDNQVHYLGHDVQRRPAPGLWMRAGAWLARAVAAKPKAAAFCLQDLAAAGLSEG
jgi:hypothetical protein